MKETINTDQVLAELSPDGKFIHLVFGEFSKENVTKVKRVLGSKFFSRDKAKELGLDKPFWRLPLDIQAGYQLRAEFGEQLVLGPELAKWGRSEKKQNDKLTGLAKATDAKLKNLPKELPKLNKYLRPYQKAGAAFAALTPNPLIADQPGLGKTVQSIAALFEAGTVDGPNLIVAPKVSLETVWGRSLREHQPHPVWIATGSRAKRDDILSDFFIDCVLDGKTGFLVVNPHMVSFRRVPNPDRDPGSMDPHKSSKWLLDEKKKPVLDSTYNMIGDVEWSNIIIDECHKNAIRNPGTLTARAMYALKVKEGGKRVALSGTPMDKPIHLWGILHWLHPDKFTNKWKWADQWMEIRSNGYGPEIGRIKPGLREEFFKSLNPYILRRTKEEVFKELPPIQFEDYWVEMDGEQAKQYKEFALMAMIKFEDENITATNVLTELLRMKQIAIAKQTVQERIEKGEKRIKLIPTSDSCKLDGVEALLDERGIIDGEGDEKVVIYSQFTEVVKMVSRWLTSKKVDHLKLTGETRDADRPKIQDEFQKKGGPRVMLMQTEAGISITLDRANTVIFMDEMWNPSDHEQAWDRLRGGIPSNIRDKDHHVTVYFIRTKGVIDEKIMLKVKDKAHVTKEIMDERRYMELI